VIGGSDLIGNMADQIGSGQEKMDL